MKRREVHVHVGREEEGEGRREGKRERKEGGREGGNDGMKGGSEEDKREKGNQCKRTIYTCIGYQQYNIYTTIFTCTSVYCTFQ